MSESLPEKEQILQLEAEWREYYKEGAFLHSRISLEPDEHTRREMAFKILALFDEGCAPIWAKLNHFKNHGHLPAAEVVVDKKAIDLTKLSQIELLQRRNNLRSYLSKAKKGDKPAKYIPEWEKQIESINQLLIHV